MHPRPYGLSWLAIGVLEAVAIDVIVVGKWWNGSGAPAGGVVPRFASVGMANCQGPSERVLLNDDPPSTVIDRAPSVRASGQKEYYATDALSPVRVIAN
jgi:hypothetical protein